MEKTHIEMETNIMGKMCILYMQPYDNLSPGLPPAVCIAKGLVNDHRDRLLAVPRDCPRKIKIVPGGKVENEKFALCGLLVNGDLPITKSGL